MLGPHVAAFWKSLILEASATVCSRGVRGARRLLEACGKQKYNRDARRGSLSSSAHCGRLASPSAPTISRGRGGRFLARKAPGLSSGSVRGAKAAASVSIASRQTLLRGRGEEETRRLLPLWRPRRRQLLPPTSAGPAVTPPLCAQPQRLPATVVSGRRLFLLLPLLLLLLLPPSPSPAETAVAAAATEPFSLQAGGALISASPSLPPPAPHPAAAPL